MRPSEHLVRFKGIKPKENPLVLLWGTLEEGAEVERFLARLRPSYLWEAFGGEGLSPQAVEEWVFGRIELEGEELPPSGLPRALWLFGDILPPNLVEAGYWWAVSASEEVPEKWRGRALQLALRKFGTSKTPLSPQERGWLYRLRKRYASGIRPRPQRGPRASESAQGVAFFQGTLGRFLASLRTSLGVTQGEVAERMGVSQERVSLLEKEHLGMRLGTLKRYVNALGLRLQAYPNGAWDDGQPVRALLDSSEGQLVLKLSEEGGEVVGEYVLLPRNASAPSP